MHLINCSASCLHVILCCVQCCDLLTTRWVIIDQFEDQFEKRSKEKEERTAKNEYQRLRNLARNKKGKVKGTW